MYHLLIYSVATLEKNKQPFVEICQILAEQEQLRATVSGAAKGALIAGCSAFVGTVLGGPLGMGIGGTLGSAVAALQAKGRFRSVADIIKNDLTEEQKGKLNCAAKEILAGNIKSEDITTLLIFLASHADVKTLLIKEIGSFLLNEIHVRMMM